MTDFEWLTVAMTGVSALALPALGLAMRLTVRLTRMTDQITALAQDGEQMRTEMYRTMREDRAVTDRRLRWLEENLWKGGRGR